jgi:hypothetical protein
MTTRDLAGTYTAGLDSITFTNDDTEQTVSMPRDYHVQSKAGILIFREAVKLIGDR